MSSRTQRPRLAGAAVLSLAVQNFTRNLKRYRVLLAALALAVAALLVMIGLTEGVHLSVRQKASRYFAGDVTIQSFRGGSTQRIANAAELSEALRELELPVTHILERSIYTSQDSTLFFAGGYINQRRLAGVDWQAEHDVLGGLNFVSGGLPAAESDAAAADTAAADTAAADTAAADTAPAGTTGNIDPARAALISTVVAERLGARVGDEIILALTTERGRRNTMNLVVSGIFSEHSFFGYTTYIDRATLNRARELPADAVSEIGLHLRSRSDQPLVAAGLHAALSELAEAGAVPQVLPVWSTRDERTAALGELGGSDQALGIMTLEAHLDEINNLLSALTIIAGAAVALFLAIVMVGVSNTYVMITYERTREIGTLRALGLTRFGTLRLFLAEAGVMGLSAAAIGLPAGLLLLQIITRGLDLSGNAWAELFLAEGRLLWSVPAWWPPVLVGAVVFAAMLGCLQPALRAAFRLQPAAALQR